MENTARLEDQQFLMGAAAFGQKRTSGRSDSRRSELPIPLRRLNCPPDRTTQELVGFLADFNVNGPRFEAVDREGLTLSQRRVQWILRECNGDGVPLDISPDAFRELFLRILE